MTIIPTCFSIRVLVLHLLPFPLSYLCQEKIEELRQGSCEFGQPKGKVLEVLIMDSVDAGYGWFIQLAHLSRTLARFILGSTTVFFEVLHFDAFCVCMCFLLKMFPPLKVLDLKRFRPSSLHYSSFLLATGWLLGVNLMKIVWPCLFSRRLVCVIFGGCFEGVCHFLPFLLVVFTTSQRREHYQNLYIW